MNKLFLIALIFLGGCHSRLFPGSSTEQDQETKLSFITGTVVDSHQFTSTEHLLLGDQIVVEVNGIRLNKYEFKYNAERKTVWFGRKAIIQNDGRISFLSEPAVLVGSTYKIYFEAL